MILVNDSLCSVDYTVKDNNGKLDNFGTLKPSCTKTVPLPAGFTYTVTGECQSQTASRSQLLPAIKVKFVIVGGVLELYIT